MSNPTAAMLVIGDEILSGRTRDANMYHLAGQLTEVGIDLKEVRVVSDDARAIVAAVKTLSTTYTHVFTSGGIGGRRRVRVGPEADTQEADIGDPSLDVFLHPGSSPLAAQRAHFKPRIRRYPGERCRPRILAIRALLSHEANATVGGPLGGLAKVGLGHRRQGGGCRCVGEPLGLLSTALGGAGVHRGLFFPTGRAGF